MLGPDFSVKYFVVKTLTEKNTQLPKSKGLYTKFGKFTPTLGSNTSELSSEIRKITFSTTPISLVRALPSAPLHFLLNGAVQIILYSAYCS